MLKKNWKKKKGSALLVAIMLSAIFAATIVGVNALAIRQLNTSKTYSNGLVALYTAESGVEEGLLRYRFNKNAEVPYDIGTRTSDSLQRIPTNAFRNFLDRNPSRNNTSDQGVRLGYGPNNMRQVYDLQVFFRQKYFGQDLNADGTINQIDLQNLDYQNYSAYKIIKDESKTFAILVDEGKLTLYWRWLEPSCSFLNPHALEVILRVSTLDENNSNDTYTTVFNDTSCRIANSSDPTATAAGSPKVDLVDDLKAKMGITSETIVEMTIRPVKRSGNGDIVFGYSQNSGNTRVTGPVTTVRSIGFYRGTTREMVANIDRQSGTILDLFNYVLYQGGS